MCATRRQKHPPAGSAVSVNDMTEVADDDAGRTVRTRGSGSSTCGAAARAHAAERVELARPSRRCGRASTATGSTSERRRARAGAQSFRGIRTGAGTNFVMLPSADVAIVALTNATPSGVPETLTAQFADLVQFGEVREDWWTLYHNAFVAMEQPEGSLVGQQAPADPAPPAPLASYVGEYANGFWGPARVTRRDGALQLALGPQTGRPADTLGRQRLHLLASSPRTAPPGTISKATFDGDQAHAGVLRRRARRGVFAMSACAKRSRRR